MSSGELSAFLFYAAAVGGAAGSLSEIHGDILRAAGAVERIFEFLSIKPSLKKVDSPRLTSKEISLRIFLSGREGYVKETF